MPSQALTIITRRIQKSFQGLTGMKYRNETKATENGPIPLSKLLASQDYLENSEAKETDTEEWKRLDVHGGRLIGLSSQFGGDWAGALL